MTISLLDGAKFSARLGAKSGNPTIEFTHSDGKTTKNKFPEVDESSTEYSGAVVSSDSNMGEASLNTDSRNSTDEQ